MGTRTPSTPKPGTQAIRAKKAAPRDLNVRIEVGAGKGRIARSGRATLTDDTFRFRTGRTGDQGADFFVHLRYEELASVVIDPSAASLTLTARDGALYKIHIGKHAPAWKDYMRPPAGRLSALGVKPGARVLLVAVADEELADEIEACVPGASAVADDVSGLESIVVGAEHPADLGRLAGLATRLQRPGGVLWVVYPSASRTLTAETIGKVAAAAGLVRGGTVAISRDHAALRLRLDTEPRHPSR